MQNIIKPLSYSLKTFLHGLERKELETVATDLLKRNPGAYMDYLMMETSTAPTDRDHSTEIPGWCVCGRCREMLQDIERKCCRIRDVCLSLSEVFLAVCANAHVLEVAMRSTEDILADVAVRNNKNYRHYCLQTIHILAAWQTWCWTKESYSILLYLGHQNKVSSSRQYLQRFYNW